MSNYPQFPVCFKIEEIDSFIKECITTEYKLDFLKNLYSEYILLCYNISDRNLSNYLELKNLDSIYPPIPYNPSSDRYQTHISRSKYIKLLRQIDEKLLPYVRNEIKRYDPSFKEDSSKIIKDYPIFNFIQEKIFEYSKSLKLDKISYLNWIIEERTNYIKELYPANISDDILKSKYQEDRLIKEISNILVTLERYPELDQEIIDDVKRKANKTPIVFRNDQSLCEFNINKIKERTQSETNSNNAIIYLLHVKKEAMQHPDLIPLTIGIERFFDNLEIEIDFYKEKQKIESTVNIPTSEVISKQIPDNSILIRLHWQDDDTLIPYLMKRLFDEGFINNADYELRKDFIEQSFYKKSGKIFTSKEVSAVESNTKANRKSNYKPGKAHKVERVIEDLKSKRDELTQKKISRTKKK